MSCLQSVLPSSEDLPWYALRTRSNAEQVAATGLEAKGFEPYFPWYAVRRRWSDRIVEATVPLFPGYIFCRFDARAMLPVVTTAGVVSVVGFGTQPAPIANDEIEAIQRVLRSGIHTQPCAFLREGEPVRICSGPLKDLTGILLKKKSEWRLVISISLLQRSISVEVDQDCVEAVRPSQFRRPVQVCQSAAAR